MTALESKGKEMNNLLKNIGGRKAVGLAGILAILGSCFMWVPAVHVTTLMNNAVAAYAAFCIANVLCTAVYEKYKAPSRVANSHKELQEIRQMIEDQNERADTLMANNPIEGRLLEIAQGVTHTQEILLTALTPKK